MLLLLSLAFAIAAPLHLEATPARLVLGDDAARATLTITSSVKPRLSANVGALQSLRRDGPETWTAEYVPPDELFPQVAIVAAVTPDEVAWIAIPLCGRGVAQARTRAKARISVTIGGETFGPAQADAHGKALVPVIVPPGVHEAWHGTQRIELTVPATPRIHLIALQERVRADRGNEVPLLVLATEEDGSPLRAARLQFRSARGEVSAPQQRGPGEYRAVWTLKPGRAGPLRLSVVLADAKAPAAIAEIVADAVPVAAVEPAVAAPVAPAAAAALVRAAPPALTISPKVGGLSNLARLNSPVAAVEAMFRTDRFGPELGFGGELAWYFASQQQDAGQLGTAQARDDFVTLSALASLRMHVDTQLTIWASAGPSLQFIASRLQVGSQPQVSESGVVPGVVLGLGIERAFARVVPFGELRWSWHADPGFSSLTGSISAFSFVVGNRFELL